MRGVYLSFPSWGLQILQCRSLSEVEELARKVSESISVDGDSIPFFGGKSIEALEEFKECFIDAVASSMLGEAYTWTWKTREAVERLVKALGLKGFTYPREFKSFMEDPRAHLKKKIFNYVYDLARGKIGFEEFTRRATAAIRTSLRTNMRTAYQVWGLATIMALLAEQGYQLAYPEHGFISFDRSGKQRLGIIPPNAVLGNPSEGFISFFHEVPRPLGWEDTSDLQRVWSLYTALRPDAMVYSGMILNIVDLSASPPVKRPDIILEFKELEDWYDRVRDLKGYFKKPLTAEEWRSMWLEGLFEGLADIMGVKRSEIREKVREARSLRLREHQLVRLYKNVYKPQRMILVSRAQVPQDIKEELEAEDIEVYNNIGFNPENLRDLAEELRKHASLKGAETVTLRLDIETARKLQHIMQRLNTKTIQELIDRIEVLLGEGGGDRIQ